MDWKKELLAQISQRNFVESQCCATIAQCHADILKRHNLLRAEKVNLTAELEKERDTTSELRQSMDVMEQRYAPSKQNTRIAELEATNKSLQQQLQRAFDGSQRLIKLQDDELVLKGKLSQAEATNAELRATIVKLEDQNDTLTRDLATTRKSEEILRTEREGFQERLEAVTKDSTRLTDEVIKAKTQVAILMNQNLELDERINMLTAELQRARENATNLNATTGGVGFGTNVSFVGRDAMGFMDESAIRNVGGYATVPLGRKVRDMENAHEGEINTCVFAPEHNKLITGGNDKVLKIWETSTADLAGSLTATGSILCSAYAADMVLAGCADNVTRVYTVSTQRARCQLSGHTDGVTAVAINQDAKRAYTGSKDRTLKQWDIKERGGFLWTRPCFSLCHDISVAANDLLITAHFDAVLRLWDTRQGTVTSEVKNAHAQPITCVRFSCADPNKFLTLGRDNALKLWDTRKYEAYATHTHADLQVPSNFCRAAWSGCGSYVTVGGTHHVSVFSGTKAGPPCIVLRNGHRGLVNCVAWSDDGRLVCSVGHDRRLILWA
jgi:autophagy-related protein 16